MQNATITQKSPVLVIQSESSLFEAQLKGLSKLSILFVNWLLSNQKYTLKKSSFHSRQQAVLLVSHEYVEF